MSTRHLSIIGLLEREKRITVQRLTESLGVSPVTVITSNLHIAAALRESSGNVIVIGGVYQRSSESVMGMLARICLQNVHRHAGIDQRGGDWR